MTDFERRSGVFCHPTALPAPGGIGTIGAPARRFLDRIAEAGQSLWQLCPLGPTVGIYGNSPYQTCSAFAIDPLLIDVDELVDRGLLSADRVETERDGSPKLSDDCVDYDAVREYKRPLLREAYRSYREQGPSDLVETVEAFDSRAEWLGDYALYRALKERFGDRSWTDWPAEFRRREHDVLERARDELDDEIGYRIFLQAVAHDQWYRLHEYATDLGIDVVGDVPIYVAHDSADVWAHRELFELDADGEPAVVAGVPPGIDDDGQKWGNPVYDWDALSTTGYAWWVDRLAWTLDLVDVVRLDHFRGFESFWAIPADAPAREGEWRPGPGRDLFETIERAADPVKEGLPAIAENLGHVTDEAETLRRELAAPGMNVMQYADWCTDDHGYQPHTYDADSVAYPSTHDTDTVRGYYESLEGGHRDCLHYYMATDGSEIHWEFIEAAWESDSVFAIAPLQDLFGLGSDARFNTPGTLAGNWEWRCPSALLAEFPAERLRELTGRTGRLPEN
ncbi:4-alpha-glucanotransferase [Halalkaliarchaeum sp. AArc-CO]|uniref:4-alpha-glucanotransferase n=1 Tax=unclassified Halalkaliarchaeum TaxID=2678344 RepID=UPI00217D0E85|nr:MULTISPECIES: 4-alpha-glucanotransferase [unclassified Halalkaliarchaeum]MDR5673497.1 4-alpha-glucanotransferase [Halalkaliarchaeum sp. AArc-GB]UWG49817.1 4-alpha-glucanotransferase [Halalkaliarchaeum sp. AArc-CO]